MAEPKSVGVDLSYVVDGMAQAIAAGVGAYFLGSGISAKSNAPSWLGLLKPHARRIGLDLKETDDLPLIAQHLVNADKGNRGPLVAAFRAKLNRGLLPNSYHAALRLTPIDTVWTTNFDRLLEDSMAHRRVVVRIDDQDFTQDVLADDFEILKVHGCIERSSPNDLIITTDDYEEFAARRPSFVQRLQHDLLHKTFLFAGYGYRDSSISTALVQARRLAKRATREHFMLLKVASSAEDAKRQALWTEDLMRVGIRCAIVQGYDEIQHVFDNLALRARDRAVFVSGGHKAARRATDLAALVGAKLSEIDPAIVLLDGQSEGIGRHAVNAFGDACLRRQTDLRQRIRIFPNPYAIRPAFSNDRSLLDDLKRYRGGLFAAARTMVVFDGGMGTAAELEVARAHRCQIVPVPIQRKGLAALQLDEPGVAGLLQKIDPAYLEKARSGRVSAADVVRCVEASLK
ncbi:MAG: SIR2 family protein [Deltaproteobacteria bacterium]|nr:SIR2 family protein [Deltaproteobacteria bacterium]